jgi:hypothetical protein
MLAHQPFELGDHLGAGPEVDPGGRLILEQAEPDLAQARPVGMEPVAVAGVDQISPRNRPSASVAASNAAGASPERRAAEVVAVRLATWRTSTSAGSSSRV